MNINEAIAKYIAENGGTCYFNWSEETKTWCLSGETADHLGWETDDVEADSREQAEAEAVEQLIENNDL